MRAWVPWWADASSLVGGRKMSNSRAEILSLCFLAATLMPVSTWSQLANEPRPSAEEQQTDFLGLRLGCTVEETRAVLEKTTNRMHLVKSTPVDGLQTLFYSGNHRLNGATHTGYSFWNNRLTVVSVRFKTEEAGKVYDALKMKMEEKYGKMTDRVTFGGRKCDLEKDGMGFALEQEDNPLGVGTVTLMAVHQGLWAAKEAQAVKEKAGELGSF